METRNSHRIIVRKPHTKQSLGTQRWRWEGDEDRGDGWIGVGSGRWKFLELWSLLLES
jgi:hypothetical protein